MSLEGLRATAYFTEHVGIPAQRPGLSRLISLAAEKPRPYDVLVVWRIDVLGTPQDAHNTVANLAEHGVQIVATEPLPPLIPAKNCLNWLRNNPATTTDPEERVDRENAERITTAPDTRRILVSETEAVLAYEYMQLGGPPDTSGLAWPFEGPTYIEYARPLRLTGPDPETLELMHWLLILPITETGELNVITLYSNGAKFQPFRHDISLQPDATPSETRDATTILIAQITAAGAQLIPHADTEPTEGREWLVLHPAPENSYPEVALK